MKLLTAMAAVSAVAFSVPAFAADVIVTDVSGLPTATKFGTYPGENTGGGTAVVSTTVARSGNGSLEMRGDRTRTQLGIQYSQPLFPAYDRTDIGALANVTGLTFDWRIAGDSTNPYNVDYTPALRLLILDGSTRKELIWEGAYNNVYGAQTVPDTWYTSSVNDKFYITGGDVNAGQTIAQWAAQLTGARVQGFSVGVGSTVTTGYHAFADNVTYTTTSGTTVYNFESAATAAVPEIGTWAMMILGVAMIGGAARYRRRSVKLTHA